MLLFQVVQRESLTIPRTTTKLVFYFLRFFGIKTEKAAGQVVVAMRDLFQVVFELKKKEIEEAKQNMDVSTVQRVLIDL
jgi:hypothetical protein